MVVAKYSETLETDKFGRWARVVYYNGFCIADITGYVKTDVEPFLEIRRCGVVNYFIVTLKFPISGSSSLDLLFLDNIEYAIESIKKLFIQFLKICTFKPAKIKGNNGL